MKLVYIVIDLTVTVHVDDLSFCEYLHGLYCGRGRAWSEEGKEENGSEYEDNDAEWKRFGGGGEGGGSGGGARGEVRL